jgi:hypothetical protein
MSDHQPLPVRAKFYVSSETPADGATAAVVEMNAVCRGVENAIWASATPAGQIRMTVKNDRAYQQFIQGEEYEVIFRHVPKPKQGDGHEPQPVLNRGGWYVCETCGSGLSVEAGKISESQMQVHRDYWGAKDESDASAE